MKNIDIHKEGEGEERQGIINYSLDFSRLNEIINNTNNIIQGFYEKLREIDLECILRGLGKLLKEPEKFKFNVLNSSLLKNIDIIKEFNKNDIFAPILYIEYNYYKIDKDIDSIYRNSDVKEFYYDRMKIWRDNMDKEGINLINEIRFSIENKLFNVSCLSMFTLIEKLLLRNGLNKNNQNDITYKDRKSFIKKSVFDEVYPISNLYKKYIKNNLYQNTKKATLFSRHSCHGKDLSKLNEKTLMNLVFIYDFLDFVFSN